MKLKLFKKRSQKSKKSAPLKKCDVSRILKLQGRNFINEAFLAFNGTFPSNDIINRYMNRMLLGMSKARVISELSVNKLPNTKYKGLYLIEIKYKIRKIPLIGKFLIFFNNYFLGGAVTKRLSIIETAIFFQVKDGKDQQGKEKVAVENDGEQRIMTLRTAKAFSYLKSLKEGNI